MRVRAFVQREVIDQDNIPSPQGRDERAFDVDLEGQAVPGPWQEPGSLHPRPAQSGDQSVAGPGIAGYGCYHPRPRGGSPKPAGQAQIHPTFIDEFQALDQRAEFLGNSLGEFSAQTLDSRRFPLASVE